jgi:hypothetical protein
MVSEFKKIFPNFAGTFYYHNLPVIYKNEKFYCLYGFYGNCFEKCFEVTLMSDICDKEPYFEAIDKSKILNGNLKIYPIFSKKYYDKTTNSYESDIINWEIKGVR